MNLLSLFTGTWLTNMYNLEDIRIKVLHEASKDDRGIITPEMFNNALKFAEISILAERLGLPEGYIPGKSVGQEAYPLTAKIEDDVRPFLKTIEVVLDNKGQAPLPSDYLRRSRIDYEYTFIKTTKTATLDCSDPEEVVTVEKTELIGIEILFNRDYTSKKFHSYKFPTEEYPICTFYDFGIEVSPLSVKKIKFDYISIPKGAYWGYNMVNEDAVYDASKSQQLQCPVDLYPKIASYILRYVAQNLGSQGTVKYAESNFNSGL